MNVVIRFVVTLISGMATFYFVFWVGSPLTFLLHPFGSLPLPRFAAPARLPAYGIGALSAYWVFERAWALVF